MKRTWEGGGSGGGGCLFYIDGDKYIYNATTGTSLARREEDNDLPVLPKKKLQTTPITRRTATSQGIPIHIFFYFSCAKRVTGGGEEGEISFRQFFPPSPMFPKDIKLFIDTGEKLFKRSVTFRSSALHGDNYRKLTTCLNVYFILLPLSLPPSLEPRTNRPWVK